MALNKKLHNKKGQSIVELAILLPVLLMLLFGILEFGRVYGAYMVIHHSARDGVRVGAVGGTTAEIQAAVQNTTTALDQDNLTINVVRSGTGDRGDVITVTVGYDITIVAPLLGIVVDNPMHLETVLSMRIE